MNMEENTNGSALDAPWMSPIRRRLEMETNCETWHCRYPPTIYRVPQSMREVDVAAYEPKILSLGPYHRGKPDLEAMEKHKWRYLQDLLSLNPEVSLERYLQEMKSMEEMTRSLYADNFELSSDEFVEMMLIDGCFIVEFLIKLRESSLEFIFTQKDIREPLFNTMWVLPLVVHDMMLLENQIPFMIPQRLFDLAVESSIRSFTEHAFIMFNCLVPMNDEIAPMPPSSVHHLLHLFHRHLLPSPHSIDTVADTRNSHRYSYTLDTLLNSHSVQIAPSKIKQALSPPISLQRKAKIIPCATELHDSGVKFRKKVKKVGSFMEIEFKNGVMRIPELYIYPNTNSFFRNLIAFEQCYPNSKTHFTAYCMFMDKFVNTQKDVMLLKEKGIIQHDLGTDEELAVLFNQLGKGINFYYSKTYLWNVYKDVKAYYESDWHKWRASLMHDYFRNPWAFLSLLGALVLLVLTIAQTVFSAIPHFSK